MKLYFLWLQTKTAAARALGRFHRDSRGADDQMNKLLIFGLVALPLLALLIIFGKDIVTKVTQTFNTVTGDPVKAK